MMPKDKRAVLETELQVKEAVTTARKEWPGIIREIGLPGNMRERLYHHWGGLCELLRIRQ